MAKKPNNTPQVGDQVRLRGRLPTGILKRTDDRLWAFVEWKDQGPKICHLHELEKINEQSKEN